MHAKTPFIGILVLTSVVLIGLIGLISSWFVDQMEYRDNAGGISTCKEKAQIQTLLHLCIKKMVHDHATTRKALNFVPRELFQSFLVSAIIYRRELCVKEIIANWPYRVLSLRTLMSEMDIVKSRVECKVCAKKHKYLFALRVPSVASLYQLIAEGFKENVQNNGKLKVLDMIGLDFLQDHLNMNPGYVTYLVLRMFDMLRQKATKKKSDLLSKTVHMDWIIDSSFQKDVLGYLKKLSPVMPLKCHALTMTEVHAHYICSVLTFVDPEVIDSLCFTRCSLTHNGLVQILPLIECLVSLTSLDLTYSLVNLNKGASSSGYTMLGNTIGKLSSLTRLRLNGNRLNGKLRCVLHHTSKPLLSIDLYSCQLGETDISYLANSWHCETLENLNLGCNNLSRDPASLFKLLTSSGSTLLHLGLETASLGLIPSIVTQLIKLSRSMRKLLTMTVEGNHLNVIEQAEIVTAFAINVSTLVTLKIPIYLSSEDTAQFDRMVVCPRLPRWDSINFEDNPNLVKFLEVCIRKFRESNSSKEPQELHVLMENVGSSTERCLFFQF